MRAVEAFVSSKQEDDDRTDAVVATNLERSGREVKAYVTTKAIKRMRRVIIPILFKS